MPFHIGQKVVCIKEVCSFQDELLPEVKAIYTVREFIPNDIARAMTAFPNDIPLIRLNEIRNDPKYYFAMVEAMECGFPSRCFRPLVDKPADISVFTKILDMYNEKANQEKVLEVIDKTREM